MQHSTSDTSKSKHVVASFEGIPSARVSQSAFRAKRHTLPLLLAAFLVIASGSMAMAQVSEDSPSNDRTDALHSSRTGQQGDSADRSAETNTVQADTAIHAQTRSQSSSSALSTGDSPESTVNLEVNGTPVEVNAGDTHIRRQISSADGSITDVDVRQSTGDSSSNSSSTSLNVTIKNTGESAPSQ